MNCADHSSVHDNHTAARRLSSCSTIRKVRVAEGSRDVASRESAQPARTLVLARIVGSDLRLFAVNADLLVWFATRNKYNSVIAMHTAGVAGTRWQGLSRKLRCNRSASNGTPSARTGLDAHASEGVGDGKDAD